MNLNALTYGIYFTLMKLFPKEIASRILGKVAEKKLPKILLVPWINVYCGLFKVDLSESEKGIYEFNTFNEFFTRRLKINSRKIDLSKNAIVSPVDGKITEFGKISNNTLLQAKGKEYSVKDLLSDSEMAKKFEGGMYVTIYLSPKDYHRIHAPLSGNISGYVYIPGSLFPVNRMSSKTIGGLFSKNERLITYLDYGKRRAVIVKIGACIVGKIRATYDNIVFDSFQNVKTSKKYSKKIPVKKAEEIGVFEIGSTVVLLFEQDSVEFENINNGLNIQMGQKIGIIK